MDKSVSQAARAMQRKSARARWRNKTAAQRRREMSALAKRRWAKASALRTKDMQEAALHEAGHFVVAEHFGLDADCWLVDCGQPTRQKYAFIGRTSYLATTPFRQAVIGWAGSVAESMLEKDHHAWLDEVENDVYYLYDLFPEALSPTDSSHIHGHPQKWRAFNTAVRILSKNFRRVHDVAREMVKSVTKCHVTNRFNGSVAPSWSASRQPSVKP